MHIFPVIFIFASNFNLFFTLCVERFCLPVCGRWGGEPGMCIMGVQCPQRSEEDIGSYRGGVRDSCDR